MYECCKKYSEKRHKGADNLAAALHQDCEVQYSPRTSKPTWTLSYMSKCRSKAIAKHAPSVNLRPLLGLGKKSDTKSHLGILATKAILDDSLGESWGGVLSATKSAASTASSLASGSMNMVESALGGLSLVWKKMLSTALKKLFAGDLAGAKKALMDGLVEVLKPMVMHMVLLVWNKAQGTLPTMIHRANMYITPIFRGKWTMQYENSITRLTKNEPKPVDGFCASRVYGIDLEACIGKNRAEKWCNIRTAMFDAYNKLSATEKQKYPVIAEALKWSTAAEFKTPCDAVSGNDANSAPNIAVASLLYAFPEWCKRTSDAGFEFKLCSPAELKFQQDTRGLWNDGYQPEPYSRLLFRRTCMKDVTKVFCEAAFYFRVLQCSTCCCVGGLLKIDKSFMMTKETSKQCASWFTWQEVMINLSMGIMRANIEKDMRNTELCKAPNYFEENQEPQCSEKR